MEAVVIVVPSQKPDYWCVYLRTGTAGQFSIKLQPCVGHWSLPSPAAPPPSTHTHTDIPPPQYRSHTSYTHTQSCWAGYEIVGLTVTIQTSDGNKHAFCPTWENLLCVSYLFWFFCVAKVLVWYFLDVMNIFNCDLQRLGSERRGFSGVCEPGGGPFRIPSGVKGTGSHLVFCTHSDLSCSHLLIQVNTIQQIKSPFWKIFICNLCLYPVCWGSRFCFILKTIPAHLSFFSHSGCSRKSQPADPRLHLCGEFHAFQKSNIQ